MGIISSGFMEDGELAIERYHGANTRPKAFPC
ncbi:hypothetical protein J2X01_003990 [Arthrobacter ginsengisoli]|uniref:Uncharacterized protein n=1 Tax=Arthrobacter ginsengisoli TaxID=1356565 RepID=A0ABU1UHK2_9MICC|nr:hypothetical protein [Arthrobacter ginsengisoli]